jgi:L-asparaginase II
MKLSEVLLVDVIRGNMVESSHLCDAVVIAASGDITMAWGDYTREIYPRSAIKPVLALPLIESGAADHFKYSQSDIALACASHNSEDIHVNAVQDILTRIGLSNTALECGAHRPYDEAASDVLVQQGKKPCRIHNNCSGKHAGFLSTAVHLGENPVGYIQPEHPVQERLFQVMSEMSGYDLTATARGADGCGIPVVGMPLDGLARTMAWMADPAGLGDPREDAARRIVAAMMAHPYMVAGASCMDTLAMQAIGGVALKTGAEGVQIAVIPRHGLGIALKVRDGNGRAGDVAMLWILRQLDMISDSAARDIAGLLNPDIKNSLNAVVGSIQVHESGCE